MSNNYSVSEVSSQRDLLLELTQQKEKLVSEGKYLEANEVKNKINEIKNSSLYRKSQTLTETQEKQNEGLEEAFNIELHDLVEFWDNKIQDFIEKGKQAETELNDYHNQQMEELINNLTNKYPAIKYSKEYLENKSIEINLAKQERFKEAHYYRVKCDKLEEKENAKYERDRNAHIQLKAEILGNKQANEKKCLRERNETQLDLLINQKNNELNKLSQKYKNIKNELDYFHKKQKIGKKNQSNILKNPIERINTLIMQKTKSKSNMSKVSESNFSTNRKNGKKDSSNHIIAENLSGENQMNSPQTETQNEQVSEMIENEQDL